MRNHFKKAAIEIGHGLKNAFTLCHDRVTTRNSCLIDQFSSIYLFDKMYAALNANAAYQGLLSFAPARALTEAALLFSGLYFAQYFTLAKISPTIRLTAQSLCEGMSLQKTAQNLIFLYKETQGFKAPLQKLYDANALLCTTPADPAVDLVFVGQTTRSFRKKALQTYHRIPLALREFMTAHGYQTIAARTISEALPERGHNELWTRTPNIDERIHANHTSGIFVPTLKRAIGSEFCLWTEYAQHKHPEPTVHNILKGIYDRIDNGNPTDTFPHEFGHIIDAFFYKETGYFFSQNKHFTEMFRRDLLGQTRKGTREKNGSIKNYYIQHDRRKARSEIFADAFAHFFLPTKRTEQLSRNFPSVFALTKELAIRMMEAEQKEPSDLSALFHLHAFNPTLPLKKAHYLADRNAAFHTFAYIFRNCKDNSFRTKIIDWAQTTPRCITSYWMNRTRQNTHDDTPNILPETLGLLKHLSKANYHL